MLEFSKVSKMQYYALGLQIILGLIAFLFVGVGYDDEFSEPSFFVKHQPSFQMHFYSSLGMSDRQLKDLSENKRKQEIAYQEFFINQHPYSGLFFFFLVPFATLLVLNGMFRIAGTIATRNRWNVKIINFLSSALLLFICCAVYFNFSTNDEYMIYLIFLIYCILCSISVMVIHKKISQVSR